MAQIAALTRVRGLLRGFVLFMPAAEHTWGGICIAKPH
jgi:hypothetical protein